MTVIGHDPVIMLEAPMPATLLALKKTGMRINDIDLFEVNEAFAPVPLAWLQATGADPARLNVHGGAIALGHPLGASGTKLMTTLLYALKRAASASACRRCAKAAGWPTSPSSSGCREEAASGNNKGVVPALSRDP